MATALTHLDPPLHHARAGRLLDSLLTETPRDVGLLACRGYVAAGAERWADALQAFESVLHLPAHPRLALEARTERAWAMVNLGRHDEARSELASLLELPIEAWPDRTTHARSHWRLGRCFWLMGGAYRTDPQHAYASFVEALKIAPSFAPAFASRGEFYLEAGSPPDHAQASQCLQKAFELDPREIGAARLLVEEFAADRQWDLVEIVARRVLAGHAGSGRQPAERVTAGSVQARRLAWAWRAVGSADLVSPRVADALIVQAADKFETATVAFQHALRGEPQHAPTWMQLGQAYRRSGKHIAAAGGQFTRRR